ncbi:MAG: hypothetical protein ACK5KN_04805 [Dysgonomonas sp.]|jgi:hypothetical protein|nr:hypothetical protein [Prevotella sp.]
MKRFTKRRKERKYNSSGVYDFLNITSASTYFTPSTISGMRMSMCCF